MNSGIRYGIRTALVACSLSIAGLGASAVAHAGAASGASDAQARDAWRVAMHQSHAPDAGCWHASYPNTRWERVECAAAPAYRSALPPGAGLTDTVGNGSDWVAQVPSGHLISSAVGSFPSVTGVKTEKSVGVPLFGDGGILGPNEYTLQVNTNFYSGSAACAGFSGCRAWQQYVLSTNTPVSLTSNQLTNETEVFIEYWLINYGVHNGSNICPAGFIDGGKDATGPGDDCVQNTPATEIASGQLPITDLAQLTLSGSVEAGGTDAATVTFGGEAYTATVADSYTDMASGWTQAEFNVLGNAGGSRADFNKPVSLSVKLAVTDGSTTAPTCIAPSARAGTTGETNNLKAGTCSATGGSSPYIEFTESN